MSLRREHSLETVVHVKRAAERAAAGVLRAARERLLAETERLRVVQRYVAEYEARAAAQASVWREFHDRKQFLLQLQSTLKAQRQAVEREERNVEVARVNWVFSRAQHAAVDNLIDRRAREIQVERNRAEQRQMDEHAARSSRPHSER